MVKHNKSIDITRFVSVADVKFPRTEFQDVGKNQSVDIELIVGVINDSFKCLIKYYKGENLYFDCHFYLFVHENTANIPFSARIGPNRTIPLPVLVFTVSVWICDGGNVNIEFL